MIVGDRLREGLCWNRLFRFWWNEDGVVVPAGSTERMRRLVPFFFTWKVAASICSFERMDGSVFE